MAHLDLADMKFMKISSSLLSFAILALRIAPANADLVSDLDDALDAFGFDIEKDFHELKSWFEKELAEFVANEAPSDGILAVGR